MKGYNLSLNKDNTCSLENCRDFDSSVVVIPSEFEQNGETYQLTEIGRCAFSHNEHITKVVIPQGVKTIYAMAFYGCKNLKEVVIPNSVTRIGYEAFSDCTSLKNICIPEGVQEIEYLAFEGCKELEYIQLPTTLTAVGHNAFLGCGKLSLGILYNYNHTICFGCVGNPDVCPKELVIEDGVVEIGSSAFQDCKQLESVSLPESLKIIGELAFAKCWSLSSINIPKTIEKIGDNAFSECDSLNASSITIASQKTCMGWKGEWSECPKKIVIPEGVTTIAEDAFRNCSNLVEVVFPSTLEVIEESAFESCEGLIELHFPDSLKKIGNSAFEECYNLKRVTFGSGLQEIEYDAFKECKSLDGIVFPNSLTAIGDDAFNGCESLTKVNITDFIEEFGDSVFANCTKLSQVEDEGLRYASFGMDVFENTAIVNQAREKGELFIVGHTVVDGRHCCGKVVIPDGIWQIGVGAFKNCVEMTGISFPDSVTALDYSAFEGCTLLDDVKLPAELCYISSWLFRDCTSLKKLELPGKFGVVYEGAFENTPWLQSQLKDNEPFILGETLYDGSQCSGTLLVEGVTTIAGGAFRGNTALNAITIKEGVNYLGMEAFYKCYNLKHVTLPAGLQTIGEGCFSNCQSLESIVIPEGVKIIRRKVFYNCCNLRHVKLPSTLTAVWSYAFSYCPKLSSPLIPTGATVSNSAFYKMSDDSMVPKPITLDTDACKRPEAFKNRQDLVEVVIPDGVKVIGSRAFIYCRNLRKVVLPESVKTIEDGAFCCTGIEEINFPKNLLTIGKEAFRQTKIDHVVLPDGLKSIGERAFYESEMKSLTIPASVKEIGSSAFSNCLLLSEVKFLCHSNIGKKYRYPNREPEHYFFHCSRLSRFESKDFPIDKNHFEGTPLLRVSDVFEGDLRIVSGCLLAVKKVLPEVVEVPEGVFYIAANVFQDRKNVVKVRLPESMRYIGDEAFKGCSRLEEINLPKGLVRMGEGVFAQCGFKRFEWPDHLTTLPTRAFEKCESLKDFVLPKTIKEFMSSNFSDCKLKTLTILNDKCELESYDIEEASKSVECILWRGDISTVLSHEKPREDGFDYNYLNRKYLLYARQQQIMLLNHYAKGLELGFDYGNDCMKRNDRKIRNLLREVPSKFSTAKLCCYEILNLILHTVFYLYVWFKEADNSKWSNYKNYYFLDGAIENLNVERLNRGALWNMLPIVWSVT